MGIAKVALPAEGPMTVQLGGGRPMPLKALSETEFQTVGVDARIVFKSEDSAVTGLVLKQGAREIAASRMTD